MLYYNRVDASEGFVDVFLMSMLINNIPFLNFYIADYSWIISGINKNEDSDIYYIF